MKEHNDDIHLQRLLNEKLEGHTVPAPDFVWPAIEKELFPPAKKRRPFFWWLNPWPFFQNQNEFPSSARASYFGSPRRPRFLGGLYPASGDTTRGHDVGGGRHWYGGRLRFL